MSNIYPDVVELQEATRAYSSDPSKENAERLRLAEAEYEKKTFECIQAAQGDLTERIEGIKQEAAQVAVAKPETKLDKTKKLITRVSTALADCRKHNQELHRMLAVNVQHKRDLAEMLGKLRERKKNLQEKSTV